MKIRFAMLFSVLLLPPLFGQTSSTEVLGTITDSSGLVISGAEVILTRESTGVSRKTESNREGIYRFPLVDPADYRIEVRMAGFKSAKISNIDVLFQQRARVDVTLEVGQLTQTVEVQAEARLLNTEDAAVGQNIDSQRIVELPVGYRNVAHLAITIPGVQFGPGMGRSAGNGARTSPNGSTVELVAHGQPGQTQGVTLDGTDVKEPRYNRMTLTPALDALEEFKVQTAAYSAEYGFSGGAQIQMVMKSGTNQFHGTMYEFLRNSALDAENYFLNFELAPTEKRKNKNAFRRNQFGAFAGGPVFIPKLYNGRNRTFWSFNYEGRREMSETPTTAWFPNTAMKNGDFSSLLVPFGSRNLTVIYDPTNGGLPFPNNVIPATRINPGVKNNLLKLLPDRQFTQADPLDFTNRINIGQPISENAVFLRIDHNISAKDRVFARLARQRQNWVVPTINPNFTEAYYNYPTSVASQWVHTISPTMLNEARFGFLKTNTDATHQRAFDCNFKEDELNIGIWRVNAPGGQRPLSCKPGLENENRIPPIGGIGSPFGDIYGLGNDKSLVLNFGDHVSIQRSKHGIKTGFEFRRTSMTRYAANYPGGYINFSGNETGHGFSSLLLGYPSQFQSAEGYPKTVPAQNQWGLYILDDWKVTPKLTLNIGLRYDHVGVPVDREGLWRTWDPTHTWTAANGNVLPTLYPDVLGSAAAVPLFKPDDRFFMPRVGIAWRPLNKWVIRAGSGWYNNSAHFNVYTILNLMPPYSAGSEYNTITDAGRTAVITADGRTFNVGTRQFRPGGFVYELGPSLFGGTATVKPENFYAVEAGRKNSSHVTWTTDIQRELPLGTAFTLGYVGSKTSNGSAITGIGNLALPSPNTDIQSRRINRYFHDALRPDVAVREAGAISMIVSGLNNFYQGVSASLDKRFSHGFAYGFYYTYSKAYGESTGPQDGLNNTQTNANWRDGRGLLPFDRRHSSVGHWVWEVPYRRDGKGLLGAVLGGWQMNGITALRSGFPFSITQGGDINTGGPVRSDRIADGRIDNPTRTLWFDPQAFQRATCNIPSRQDLCHYGNSGVGILSTPAERRLDLSASKNFRLAEGVRLQFRLEAFNSTNHPWFGQPNGVGYSTVNSVKPDGTRMGEIRSLETPMRSVQAGLKLYW